MNYIKKLESELRASQEELRQLKDGITELKSYLQSEKFWMDTTVQTRDVLNRLEEAQDWARILGQEQLR